MSGDWLSDVAQSISDALGFMDELYNPDEDLEDAAGQAAPLLWAGATVGAERLEVGRAEMLDFVSTKYEAELQDIDRGIAFARGLLYFLSRDASLDGTVPNRVRHVAIGLGSRAVALVHECRALIASGLPLGARARWRTLVEIATVANALSLGGQALCDRYVAHGVVALHLRFASLGLGSPYVEKIEELREQYGPTFVASDYGWADQLVKERLGPKARASAKSLLEISDFPMGSWSKVANHSVHGDYLGLLQLDDGEGVFTDGVSHEGLSILAAETIVSLGYIVERLVALCGQNRDWLDSGPLGLLVYEFFTDLEQTSALLAVSRGEPSRADFPLTREVFEFDSLSAAFRKEGRHD